MDTGWSLSSGRAPGGRYDDEIRIDWRNISTGTLPHAEEACAARRLEASERDEMRALKILVTVMGIVIVVGFGVVIAVIAGRLARRDATSMPRTFAAGAVNIPHGARIEAMTAASDRLILDLVLPGGGRDIIVIDLVTGARLGTIELHPEP
jgi:hypothetical protein